MKKTIICLGVVMSFLTTVCFGAKVDPAKIVVPRASGRIVETYVAPNADAPVIAYVQDIHVNYEAQKAEADILEALIRDYGFDLVLVEGTGGDVNFDLKKFRTKPKEVRDLAADTLLKKGAIEGIDYFDITSDYNFVIQGIEDMALYKAETQDHVDISGKNADTSKLVATLQNIASNLKLHIYTKEMRDLDDKIGAYDKDEIGLVEYVKFVQGVSAANNIEVKTFPNVALFIESANLEGQIDFPAVEKERTTAVDAIEKALTDQAKKDDFASKGLSFRTGDISQGAYYAYLKDTAASAKVDISAYKNLANYTQYITTYEKIDTSILFKELDSWVNKTTEALIKTPEQKKLADISKGLEILSGFANTKLVPDEYNYYVQNKARFDLDGWFRFMKDNSVKFALTNQIPDDISVLKTSIPLFEKFYAAAFDRDQAFVKNIGANLTKYSKDRAILITGGFHTVNMKGLLKEKGYSYVVIAPRVDIIKDYSGLAKERMKIDLEIATQEVKKTATVPAVSHRKPARGETYTPQQVQEGINEAEEALKKAEKGSEAEEEARAALNAWEELRKQGEMPPGQQNIGKVRVDNFAFDGAKITATVQRLDKPGEGSKAIDVPAREILKEEIQKRLNAFLAPYTGTPMVDVIRQKVQAVLDNFKGNFVVMDDNLEGIGGRGSRQIIALVESLFMAGEGANFEGQNMIGLLHEMGEVGNAMGLAGFTAQDILAQLDQVMSEEEAKVARAWYDQHMARIKQLGGTEGEFSFHYAWRALVRFSGLEKADLAFTRQVKKFMEVFDAVKEGKEHIQSSSYRIIIHTGKEGTITDELKEALGKASAKKTTLTPTDIVAVSDDKALARELSRAKSDNVIPLVVLAKDVANNLTEKNAYKGVAILAVENFEVTNTQGDIVQGVIDNVVGALMLMDHLNRQVKEGKLTEAQLAENRAVQSLQAIVAELRGVSFENVSAGDIMGLLAIKDDKEGGLQERLIAIVKWVLLPARAISIEKALEIMATRSIILSA